MNVIPELLRGSRKVLHELMNTVCVQRAEAHDRLRGEMLRNKAPLPTPTLAVRQEDERLVVAHSAVFVQYISRLAFQVGQAEELLTVHREEAMACRRYWRLSCQVNPSPQ